MSTPQRQLLGDPPRPSPARLGGNLTWRRLAAVAAVMFFAIFTSTLAADDGVTYYAAGERLNAGHSVYALTAGDRPVWINPPYWTSPLLSPPLIAVLFRPLALLPISVAMLIWVGGQAVSILTLVFLVVRDRRSLATTLALALPLGLAMVLGNVNGFLLVGYAAAWRFRHVPAVGALIALMGSVKILPFALVGWLVARRDLRALVWFAAACVGCLAVGIVGAGWQAHLDYLGVLATSLPQRGSVGDITGIRWFPAAALIAGTILAASLRGRSSYRASLLTIVFAAPTYGPTVEGQLLALVVPNPTDTSNARVERRRDLLTVVGATILIAETMILIATSWP